jgi:hypothetical protein
MGRTNIFLNYQDLFLYFPIHLSSYFTNYEKIYIDTNTYDTHILERM